MNLCEIPDWYIAIATLFSIYYGIRAIRMQRINAKEKSWQNIWNRFDIIFILYVQDFLFNFVCSVSGFLSLFLDYKILSEIENFAQIDAGITLFIAFLSLMAIVGVSGQLPFVILMGKESLLKLK